METAATKGSTGIFDEPIQVVKDNKVDNDEFCDNFMEDVTIITAMM